MQVIYKKHSYFMPNTKRNGKFYLYYRQDKFFVLFYKKMKRVTAMNKALYILLLVIEAASLFFPLFFILYFHGFLVSVIVLLAIAAVYAFLGICAFKQKKSEDEAGLKKLKIIIALVCPAVWAVFIVYFLYICTALGVI